VYQRYFDLFQALVEQHNIDPRDIYNMDEKGFIEDYVLINGTKELMQEVGRYIWEDSVEISGTLYWTPNLPDKFQAMYNASISFTSNLASLIISSTL